jgi:RNA polymerase sigma-70 factor
VIAAFIDGARGKTFAGLDAWLLHRLPPLFPDANTAEAFAYFLGERCQSSTDLERDLDAVVLPDLALVFRHVAGDRDAATEISKLVLTVQLGASRSRLPDDIVDEARQRVLERIMLGSPPKIAQYDGRAPLGSWLRVSIAREAIYLHKRGQREVDLSEELLVLPSTATDPELELFKRAFRSTYRAAFEAAVESLSTRERSILRQHLVLLMSIDELATVYGVHRATTARWVADAKDGLGKRLRSELATRLKMSQPEIDRVIGLVESRLDITVHRIFRTTGSGSGTHTRATKK